MNRNSTPILASPAGRRLDLDNLRNAAVLLLVAFHTARLFDGETWHIKDAARYGLADMVVRLLNQWQMPILFLVAGVAAWLAQDGRGIVAFLRERVLRLLVPLLAGILLAVYPQVYVERIAAGAPGRASPIDFTGGPLDFLPQFFVCCYPQANFSYHHLWFVWYLFAYSIALAPLFLLARAQAVARALQRMADGFDSVPRLLVLGLPLLLLELSLRPRFPGTHAFVDDWANHAHYAYLILVGWVLGRSGSVMNAVAMRWPPLLVVATAASLAWLSAPDWVRSVFPDHARAAMTTIRAAGEWIWLLALLGVARRFFDRRIALLTSFTRYAFPFYIAHQAFIVILGWIWLGWSDMPVLKYLAVALLSLVASLAFCRLMDVGAATRFLVGMKPRRRVAACPPQD